MDPKWTWGHFGTILDTLGTILGPLGTPTCPTLTQHGPKMKALGPTWAPTYTHTQSYRDNNSSKLELDRDQKLILQGRGNNQL